MDTLSNLFSPSVLLNSEGFCESPVWADPKIFRKWQPIPILKEDQTCDVCVIGLGASGLAAVIKLQQSGLSVVGIDAWDVAACAAGQNGGFLLAGLDSEYHENCERVGRFKTASLYKETVDELNSIFEEYPNCTKRTGSLRLGYDDENMLECFKQYQAIKKDGFPISWYCGPEGEGFHVPIDGVFDPLLRARTMALKAIKLGAKLYGHARAIDISSGLVKTEAGNTITC
jgi:glycine/D-amino acid oxidase-like deaminating enzyme